MRKNLLMLFLVCTAINCCSAQRIEIQKGFGGYKFTQNGKNLRMGNLVEAMEVDPQAFSFIKKAQTQNTVASVVGFAGGALLGFSVGRAIAGGGITNANSRLTVVGAGLVAVGIPFSRIANKKARQAVELYNSYEGGTTLQQGVRTEFKIAATGSEIGLTMTF